MSQTLSAFLAMVIIMLVAYNQQQWALRTYEDMVHSEYEIMASAVAIQEIELIAASVEFDALETLNQVRETATFQAGDTAVDFEVEYMVEFVDDSGVPSAVPTDLKEVTVTVWHDRYALPLLTEARLLAP